MGPSTARLTETMPPMSGATHGPGALGAETRRVWVARAAPIDLMQVCTNVIWAKPFVSTGVLKSIKAFGTSKLGLKFYGGGAYTPAPLEVLA